MAGEQELALSSKWVQRSKSSYRVRAPGSVNTWDPSGLGCSIGNVSAFRMFKWVTGLGCGPQNPISEGEKEAQGQVLAMKSENQ